MTIPDLLRRAADYAYVVARRAETNAEFDRDGDGEGAVSEWLRSDAKRALEGNG